jgi:catechol 2,3-dioxygenase-like lactoylglutathione lyase family enzyme
MSARDATWPVIPAIRVKSMADALNFYVGVLGFEVERGGPEEENMAISRGAARLMLEVAHDQFGEGYNAAIRERLGSKSAIALYIEARDLDKLHERVQADRVPIVDPLADRPWGQAEFTIEDPEGNWLTFWRESET